MKRSYIANRPPLSVTESDKRRKKKKAVASVTETRLDIVHCLFLAHLREGMGVSIGWVDGVVSCGCGE